MRLFFECLLFVIIIGAIIYFAMFHGRETTIYACSEVTKDDPADVRKMCRK